MTTKSWATVTDAGHTIRIVFPEYGGGRPYVEVSEQHTTGEPNRPPRTMPLPEVVHALMNLGEMEFYEVGARLERK